MGQGDWSVRADVRMSLPDNHQYTGGATGCYIHRIL